MPPVSFGIGLSDRHLQEAALLYDDAFGPKFQVAIRSRADRISLLEKTFVGDLAITATAKEHLVGLAGLHTADGSLTGGIGAQRLYERHGFVAVRTERLPYLRWLLGFGASKTMELRLAH